MATPAWLRSVLGMGAPVLSGHTDYNIRSEDLKREVAKQVAANQQAVQSSGGYSSTDSSNNATFDTSGGTGFGIKQVMMLVAYW